MPTDIQPPTPLPNDEETTPVNVEKLSDAELGGLVRRELNGADVRFVKAFYAKVGGRWALHLSVVTSP